jgi:hypothetical protein
MMNLFCYHVNFDNNSFEDVCTQNNVLINLDLRHDNLCVPPS